jgi:disulfide bond formation protein DsbB
MSSGKPFTIGPFGFALGLFLASLGVLGSAYAAQYWGGLAPCKLCLYQRWPWWIVGGLGLLALWVVSRPRLWRFAIGFCGLTLMAGAGLAVYHVGVEQHWWLGPASCTSSGTPASFEELKAQILAAPVVLCDQIRWSLFGITLAGFNAIVSFIVATASLLAVWSSARREES